MTKRVTLSRFRDTLRGMASSITLYRCGRSPHFLTQYSYIYELLELVRPELEASDMYMRCSAVLESVEALVHWGPERDEEAQIMLRELLVALGDDEKNKDKSNAQDEVDFTD